VFSASCAPCCVAATAGAGQMQGAQAAPPVGLISLFYPTRGKATRGGSVVAARGSAPSAWA